MMSQTLKCFFLFLYNPDANEKIKLCCLKYVFFVCVCVCGKKRKKKNMARTRLLGRYSEVRMTEKFI